MTELILSALAEQVEQRGVIFALDEGTRDRVARIAKMLTEDSPKFGILLLGGTGTGKTTLALAIRRALNILANRGVIDHPHIRVYKALDLGDLLLEKEATFANACRYNAMIIDDLGEEASEQLIYGRVYKPAAKIIEQRYEDRRFTIFTSNLTPAQLSDHYGPRISSRLEEMCIKIGFTNQDYRRFPAAQSSESKKS